MNSAIQPSVILLVEDEETDAYLVKWALEKNRLPVDLHQASDGYEALNFFVGLARVSWAPRAKHLPQQ